MTKRAPRARVCVAATVSLAATSSPNARKRARCNMLQSSASELLASREAERGIHVDGERGIDRVAPREVRARHVAAEKAAENLRHARIPGEHRFDPRGLRFVDRPDELLVVLQDVQILV